MQEDKEHWHDLKTSTNTTRILISILFDSITFQYSGKKNEDPSSDIVQCHLANNNKIHAGGKIDVIVSLSDVHQIPFLNQSLSVNEGWNANQHLQVQSHGSLLEKGGMLPLGEGRKGRNLTFGGAI